MKRFYNSLLCLFHKVKCLIGARGTLSERRPFINRAEGISSYCESILASTAMSTKDTAGLCERSYHRSFNAVNSKTVSVNDYN